MTDMKAWADRLYAEGVDRKDAGRFADAFVENGWLRFANNPPVVGRDSIREAIAQFFTLFESLQHEPVATTWSDGVLVLEANVTYTLFSGGTVTVPACTIYRIARDGGEPKAERCQIYVDLSPLFSTVQGN